MQDLSPLAALAVSEALDAAVLADAYALRCACFRGDEDDDRDAFDPVSRHFVVRDGARVICTFRVRFFENVADAAAGYTGQFYKLGGLAHRPGRIMELGRFCVARDCDDVAVLRLAWAQLARMVLQEHISVVLGCASIARSDDGSDDAALRYLTTRFVDPALPAGCVVDAAPLPQGMFKAKDAAARVPPLLRSYLNVGARVGPDYVRDDDLRTLHVLVVLDPRDIPPARMRSLARIGSFL